MERPSYIFAAVITVNLCRQSFAEENDRDTRDRSKEASEFAD